MSKTPNSENASLQEAKGSSNKEISGRSSRKKTIFFISILFVGLGIVIYLYLTQNSTNTTVPSTVQTEKPVSLNELIARGAIIVGNIDADASALKTVATNYITTRQGAEATLQALLLQIQGLLSTATTSVNAAKTASDISDTQKTASDTAVTNAGNDTNIVNNVLVAIQNIIASTQVTTTTLTPSQTFTNAIIDIQTQQANANAALNDVTNTQLVNANNAKIAVDNLKTQATAAQAQATTALTTAQTLVNTLFQDVTNSPAYTKLNIDVQNAQIIQTSLLNYSNNLPTNNSLKATLDSTLTRLNTSITSAKLILTSIINVFTVGTLSSTNVPSVTISGIVTVMNDLTSKNTTIQGYIANITTKQGNINTNISSIQQSISDMTSKINLISTSVNSMLNIVDQDVTSIQNILTQITTAFTNAGFGLRKGNYMQQYRI